MSRRTDIVEEAEYEEEGYPRRAPRWFAATVMVAASVGFVGLAYYAYHAGTRSMQGEELLLVEADSAPVKEKPTDPGGMKFPHQDKAIFDAMSSSPTKTPQVERVLPSPEQPMNPETAANAQNPTTDKNWVNDKLSENGDALLIEKQPDAKDAVVAVQAAEDQVIVAAAESQAKPPMADAKLAEAANALSPAAGQPESTADTAPSVSETSTLPSVNVQPVTTAPAPVELKKAPAAAAQPMPAPAPVKQKAPATEAKAKTPAEIKAKAAPAKSGSGLVQLGAYRSEAEANAAWKKLSSRSELSGLSPDIQKADLGQKGVFYRLRANTGDAKGLCQKLAGKGQPCIVVK